MVRASIGDNCVDLDSGGQGGDMGLIEVRRTQKYAAGDTIEFDQSEGREELV
jgi:hypothetical protein